MGRFGSIGSGDGSTKAAEKRGERSGEGGGGQIWVGRKAVGGWSAALFGHQRAREMGLLSRRAWMPSGLDGSGVGVAGQDQRERSVMPKERSLLLKGRGREERRNGETLSLACCRNAGCCSTAAVVSYAVVCLARSHCSALYSP